MRNISFNMTIQQIKTMKKTVTRRKGWLFLKVGDLLQGVEKAMGLKKGEKIQKLSVVKVTSIRRERVDAITEADVIREGFESFSTGRFIALYCNANSCKPSDLCTRIEFEYAFPFYDRPEIVDFFSSLDASKVLHLDEHFWLNEEVFYYDEFHRFSDLNWMGTVDRIRFLRWWRYIAPKKWISLYSEPKKKFETIPLSGICTASGLNPLVHIGLSKLFDSREEAEEYRRGL